MSVEITKHQADQIICDGCKRNMHMAVTFVANYGTTKPEHYCLRCVKDMLKEL